MLDFRELWDEAITYERFVAEAQKNRSLWEIGYRRARIPPWAEEGGCALGLGVKLLVISEDWCGDASNTIPVLARLGDENDCLELRVLRRDDYPEVMDQYRTNGSRSIPIVIALDSEFNEIGHWGPRPSELQAWVMDHRDRLPSPERYKHVRTWYARDRGVATLREVLGMLESKMEDGVANEGDVATATPSDRRPSGMPESE